MGIQFERIGDLEGSKHKCTINVKHVVGQNNKMLVARKETDKLPRFKSKEHKGYQATADSESSEQELVAQYQIDSEKKKKEIQSEFENKNTNFLNYNETDFQSYLEYLNTDDR